MHESNRERSNVECLCIGHSAYDLIFPLDHFPQEDSKTQIRETSQSGGGPAANAAFLLAKWDVATAFAGVIGADWCGQLMLEEFASVGVDTTHLSIRSEVATPLSVVLVNQKKGSRTIVNRSQTGAPLVLDDQRLQQLSPQVLLFDGHELNASLLAMQRFPQAVTLLDGGSLREGTRVLAASVDYAIVSEKFAREFANVEALKSDEAISACLALLNEHCRGQAVITLGNRGCAYSKEGSLQYVKAISVDSIDSTAAGDIFHGAFAWGVLQQWPLERALGVATVAAGVSTQRVGGRSSIPALDEVLDFIGNVSD